MNEKNYGVTTATTRIGGIWKKISERAIKKGSKNLKNTERGITVLQLVVTIIVLLILAGIIISFITGKNGVIARADDSKAAWTRASELEQLKLAYSACETDYESIGTPITSEKMGSELKNVNSDTKVEEFDMVNENLNDYEITIDRKDETGYAKATFTQTQHMYIVALVQVNEIIAKYNVTYDANRGEGAPAKQVKIHGQTLTLSNIQPKRLGYTFKGWAKSPSSIYSEYSGGQIYNDNADLALYAVWSLDEYTITYNLDGGQNSSKNPIGYDIDTPTFYLAEPTKENSIFTGWVGSDISSITKSVAIRKGTTGNKEYKANWDLAYYSVDDSSYTKTLNEAINIAKSGSKIKVLRNSNESESIKDISGDITLDLAGNTITTASTINIISDSKLTIIDSGNNNEYTGKIKNTVGTVINNNGTLQIGKDDGNIMNSPYIESNTEGIYNVNGNLLFYDGEITAKTAINGDSVTTPSTYYAMSNANAEAENETVTLQTLGTAVCRIGYKYYSTLQNAIDETPSGTYKEDTKEVAINNTLINNGTYYFEKDADGKFKSNNKGKQSSVANSYLTIDLSEFDSSKDISIKVNANISSESNYDFGYATITDSTTFPLYNSTAGQFIKISGNIADKDYTTTIKGGKIYYLHFGYRKDGSADVGNDLFTINNVSINGTDISNEKINITTQTPVIPENESTITLLNNVTLTSNNTTINELKNLNIELGDYLLSSSGTNAKIINNGKLRISSKTGKGKILSSGYEVIYNDTINDFTIENLFIEELGTSALENSKGNININNTNIIYDGNILYSSSGKIEIKNSIFNNSKTSRYTDRIIAHNSKIIFENDQFSGSLAFKGNSEFEINKCNFDPVNENNEKTIYNIEISENAKVTFNESNVKNYKIVNDKTSNLTLIKSSIKVITKECRGYSRGALIKNDGICIIKDTDMYIDNYITIENVGNLTIGTNDGKIENNLTSIKTDSTLYSAIKNTGVLNIYDGIISGKNNLMIGNITDYDRNFSIVENYDQNSKYYSLYLTEVGVCEINGKTYKTIEDAISDIKSSNDQTTIKILNSTKANNILNIENKNINIDLNGFEIETSNNIMINENSLLLINDNSENKNGKIIINNGYIQNNGKTYIKDITLEGGIDNENIIVNNNEININNFNILTNNRSSNSNIILNFGNLTMNDGKIENILNKEDYNYSYVFSTGIINKENGNIEISNVDFNVANPIVNEKSGNIKINSGNFEKSSYIDSYFLKNLLDGKVIINGCNVNFQSKGYGIYNNNGIIEIYGDTKINTYYTGIYNKSGNINIFGITLYSIFNTIENDNGANLTIGKKDGNIEEQSINISSGKIEDTDNYGTINNNGNLYFYGGVIKGIKKAIAGKITEVEEGFTINLETEFDKKYTNRTYEVIKLKNSPNYEYNGKEYNNFESVINDVPENTTYTNNISIESGNIDISNINIKNKNIVLDLNGKDLQFAKTINIDKSSKLKITDSKFSNESKNGVSFATTDEIENTKGIDNYGTLEIIGTNLKSIMKSSIFIFNEKDSNLNIQNTNIENNQISQKYSIIKEKQYWLIYNLGNLIFDNTIIKFSTSDFHFENKKMNLIENIDTGIIEIDDLKTSTSDNYYDYGYTSIKWTILNTSGKMTISSIKSVSSDGTNIENYDGNLEINNGDFFGTINNEKGNDIIINDGKFKKINNNLNGKIIINNGDIDTSQVWENKNAIYNNIGTIIIGKKDGNISEEPIIRGKENAIQNISGKINYYDGILIGNNTPVLGEISELEDESGIETTYNIDKKYYESKLIKKEIAEIGDTKYYSLVGALNNAKVNDNIKLIASGSELNELNINKDITIDLNGYNVDLRNRIIINEGINCKIIDSSIEKSGTINLYKNGITTEYSKSIENNGNLNLMDVSIYDYGEYSYQIYNYENSILTINDSNIVGKIKNTYQIYNKSIQEVNINNSKISREFTDNTNANNSYMIYNENTGIINLNNDIINSTEDSLKKLNSIIELVHNEKGNLKILGGTYSYSGGGSNYTFRIIYNQKDGEFSCKNADFEITGARDSVPYSAYTEIIVNSGDSTIEDTNIKYNASNNSIEDFIAILNSGNLTYINTNIKNISKKSMDYNIGILQFEGNLNLKSGNIDGFGYGISKGKDGNIYIGTKGGEIQSKSPIIKGDRYGIGNEYSSEQANNIYFYDGTISGKTGANQFEFTEIEPNYQIYTSIDSDGYTNVSLAPIGGTVNVASIGSVNYASLQDAIASCTTGGESIVLTRDIELDTSTINIDGKKNITINLNGHKITSSSTDCTLNNNGTLIIKDTSSSASGSITNSSGPAIINNGILNMGINNDEAINNSPTIEGTTEGIENTVLKGILNLYNGKIIGEKSVNGNPINESKSGYIINKNIENSKEVVSLIKQ